MNTHKAQKKWGQNFLKDTTIIDKIMASVPRSKHAVYIEIGPGKGALTEGLLALNRPVIAYEIDRNLEPTLNARFNKIEDFHLIMDDFLNRDISNDIHNHQFSEFDVHVVANLPYYITTPIIRKCLDLANLKSITIMVQDEVAKRLSAQPSTKDYGALTVLSQYYANIDYLFQVPPHVFHPAPKVHSAVIQLTIKPERILPVDQEKSFETFIHQCFKQKRKTLINNLSSEYTNAKDVLTNYFEDEGLNPQTRAEALNLNHLVHLFQKISIRTQAKN